jgi:hypothetical protein
MSYWNPELPTQSEYVYSLHPTVSETFVERSVGDIADYVKERATKEIILGGLAYYARKKPEHLAARAIGYSIPFLGWGIFAYEVYNLVND